MSKPELMIPLLHLNGTSREGLTGPLQKAHRALYEAEQTLAETAPNGRDYYPRGNDAHRVAQGQHYDRQARLRAIREEIEALYLGVDEQAGGR